MRHLIFALLVLLPLSARADGPTVFAAASLTDAFHDIAILWQAKGHKHVTLSFGASSSLAQQILHGAPADIFASADEAWMDRVQAAGRIVPATRIDLVGNRLVLVARGTATLDLTKPDALLALLGPGGRLAVADPAHVPAGIYAAQSLKKLGLWAALKDHLAPAEDVRGALRLVSHGEAPAGIVYQTDITNTPALHVIATFPDNSHDPIRYPVATTPKADPEAAAFFAFLASDDARVVLQHYGFLAP